MLLRVCASSLRTLAAAPTRASLPLAHSPHTRIASPRNTRAYNSNIIRALNMAFSGAAATPLIGTHDGTFHCDEALAVWMLRQTSAFSSAPVLRTRDPAKLATAQVVVDVGGVYEPQNHRYDHHQRGFAETLSPKHTMKLSSAGLVYKHFGREVVAKLTGLQGDDLEIAYQQVYKNFVEAIDGIDNGVAQFGDAKPIYKLSTDLSSRVSFLNPDWNETGVDITERFEQAVALTGKELSEAIFFLSRSWLPARALVHSSLLARFDVHPSGQIVKLEQYTLWKSHLYELEKEMKVPAPILYVLYQDDSQRWRVQCVGVEHMAFDQRKSLPEPWRGVRDAQLAELSGVSDAIFVHAAGFIGGAHSYTGALAMAVAGLNWSDDAAAKRAKTCA